MRRSLSAWSAAVLAVHAALWLPGTVTAAPEPMPDPRGRPGAEETPRISAQLIFVMQPRESDTVVIGTPVVIRFAAPRSSAGVDVLLVRGTEIIGPLARGTPTTTGTELAGALALIWPARTLSGVRCPPGSGYRVLVRDSLRPSVAGLSGQFTVRAPGVVSPTSSRPPAVSPLPNLQVLCRNAGGPSALILNRGSGVSLPTVVAIQKRVAMPGPEEPILITLGEKPVPPLDAYCEAAGCRCRFELQLEAPDDPWFDGATIVLTVDPHDAVKESDETDNRCVLVVPAARSRRGR